MALEKSRVGRAISRASLDAVAAPALGVLALLAFLVASSYTSTGRWYVDAVVPAAAALAVAAVALGWTARKRLRNGSLGRWRLASFGVLLGVSTLVLFCGLSFAVAIDTVVAASATDGSAFVIRPCPEGGETAPPPAMNEDGSLPAIPPCSRNDPLGDEARDGRLSLHGYTAKAGTICREEMGRFNEIRPEPTLGKTRPVMKQLAAVLTTLTERLSDLRPPERVEADVDRMLDLFAAAAAGVQKVSEAEDTAEAERLFDRHVAANLTRATYIAFGIGINEGCELGGVAMDAAPGG